MMKRLLTLLLAAILLCSCISCAARSTADTGTLDAGTSAASGTGTPEESDTPPDDGTSASAARVEPYQRQRLSYTVVPADPAQYVRPVQKTYSAEEQAVIDDRYQQMIERYPIYAAIPRDMLRVGHSSVETEFMFCIGGVTTDCSCTFWVGQSTDDRWSCFSMYDGLVEHYYALGLTEQQMSDIRALLLEQTLDYIHYYHLDDSNVEESMHMYWTYSQEEGLCARSETIADVTPETIASFGCVTHEHVMIWVYIEVAEEE